MMASPDPEYMAKFGEQGRDWMARWSKRMEPGRTRTRAAIDANINISLPRQWALLQPKNRLDAQGRIAVQGDVSMSWTSGLAPGLNGVRTLVVSLLNWGAHAKGAENEQAEWRLVAADVALVLQVLARKAGPAETNTRVGRKKYVEHAHLWMMSDDAF